VKDQRIKHPSFQRVLRPLRTRAIGRKHFLIKRLSAACCTVRGKRHVAGAHHGELDAHCVKPPSNSNLPGLPPLPATAMASSVPAGVTARRKDDLHQQRPGGNGSVGTDSRSDSRSGNRLASGWQAKRVAGTIAEQDLTAKALGGDPREDRGRPAPVAVAAAAPTRLDRLWFAAAQGISAPLPTSLTFWWWKPQVADRYQEMLAPAPCPCAGC